MPGVSLCIHSSNNAADNFTLLSFDDLRAKYYEYKVCEESHAVKCQISRPSSLFNVCDGNLQMGGFQPAPLNYRNIKQQQTL